MHRQQEGCDRQRALAPLRRLHARRASRVRATALGPAAQRPAPDLQALAPPAWMAHLPTGRAPWRTPSLAGAYILIALVFVASLLSGPLSAAAIFYVPSLLLIAALSRALWQGYGVALLLVLLNDLAYQLAPASVQYGVPGAALWPWYLLTRGITYGVVVLLTQALVHALATVQCYVQALEQAHAQAWALALTDPLTGLANRRRFDGHLEAEIARCSQQSAAVAVLLLDVDGFKGINDRWGHAVGDAALGQVAQALGASLRAGDLAARVGGDEFAAVLPLAGEAEARRVAQAIQDRLAASAPRGVPGRPVQVSIGVASITPCRAGRAVPPTAVALTVMAAADRALYQVKNSVRQVT